MRYGRRIKLLKLKYDSMVSKLSQKTLKDLALRRPSISLTPNLRELALFWSFCEYAMDLCFLIFHENVRCLTLHVPYFSSQLLECVSTSLFQRSMGINILSIKVESDFSNSLLCEFVKNILPLLPNLHELSLPIFGLSTELFLTLPRISPNLKKVGRNCGVSCLQEPRSLALTAIGNQLLLHSLVELQIGANFHILSNFEGANFPSLVSLRVDSFCRENALSLQKTLERITVTFPSLNDLYLRAIFEVATSEHATEGSAAEISCKTLKAVTSLKQLKKFHLKWPLPLRGTDVELSEILSQMPQIEKLVLNSNPGDPTAPVDMTPDVLPLIAQHCHSLRDLALFVNCTAKSALCSPISRTQNYGGRLNCVFRSLESLSLGRSPVDPDPQSLALKLSRVLLPTCKLYGPARYERQTWYDAWPRFFKEVAKLTRILIAVKVEEQDKFKLQTFLLEERIRQLENELQKHLS